MDDEALVVVATFATDAEADIAEAALAAHGVRAIVMRDNAGGAMPWLNTLHPVRIAVDEREAHLAIELLRSDAPS